LHAQAQEIIEWRGPGRTGVYQETGLLKKWPEQGPEMLWSLESLPKGHSSVSVTNDCLYLTGTVDEMDVLVAVDLKGKIKWQTPYGQAWNASWKDSRCTPTIEGNRVFVSSGLGDLACLNVISGEIIWKVKASEKFEGTFPRWGIAESILIVEDKVIYSPGGSKTTIVALDKNTGKTAWMSESLKDTPGYVSPIVENINGKKVIINVMAKYLLGVDAENGHILWHKNYADIENQESLKIGSSGSGPYINCITPIYKDGKIYVTSGYDHVGIMFNLKNNSELEIVWINKEMDVHHGGVVLLDGYIYGSNFLKVSTGSWCCIDWNTGKTMYETKWMNKGSVISAEGMLYCYDEKRGNIALVKATPEGFEPVNSFKVPLGKGPHWSHLVIKDKILYVRHMNALMAYSIAKGGGI